MKKVFIYEPDVQTKAELDYEIKWLKSMRSDILVCVCKTTKDKARIKACIISVRIEEKFIKLIKKANGKND